MGLACAPRMLMWPTLATGVRLYGPFSRVAVAGPRDRLQLPKTWFAWAACAADTAQDAALNGGG